MTQDIIIATLLVAALVGTYIYQPHFSSDSDKVDCRKKFKYDQWKDPNDPDYPENYKCFLACEWENLNAFEADGSLKKEVVLKAMEKQMGEVPPVLIDRVNDCFKKVKAVKNRCETAHRYEKCFGNTEGWIARTFTSPFDL